LPSCSQENPKDEQELKVKGHIADQVPFQSLSSRLLPIVKHVIDNMYGTRTSMNSYPAP
jgi:hypothetical protein